MTASSLLTRLRPRAWLLAASAIAAFGALAVQPAAAASDIIEAQIAHGPLYAATLGDRPTIALALSVEFPTVGAQYPTADGYSPSNEYLGYYNHEKCYTYNTAEGYFEISSSASGRKCSGDKEFSGNFMNWATGSAIDMIRLALTGGDRVIDKEKITVLQRAYIPDGTDANTKNSGPHTCFFKQSGHFGVKTLSESDGGGDYAGAVPKDLIEAVEDQESSRPNATKGKIYIASAGNRIYFGNHPMGGTNGNCTYGPYNYALGAGGKVGEFHSVRNNAFFGTSEHTQCNDGEQCTADSKGQRVWYGNNCGENKGCRWHTGIVKDTFTCGSFGDVDNHGDTDESEPTAGAKCYLEDDDAMLSGETEFFYARVKVCDSSDDRDYYMCSEYPSGSSKPTGVIQKYSDGLRMAAFGYAMDHTHAAENGRYGGVLRAPMKYVGHDVYNPVGRKTDTNNPRAEWDQNTGVFFPDPENAWSGTPAAGQVQLPSDAVGYAAEDKTSGVINYLNRFGRNPKSLGNYKANDPVGELYYETLRYMQGMGAPTPAAVRDLDDRMLDGSPVYTGWDDPYGSDLGYSQTTDYSCIRSQIVLVGDINAHDANSSPKYPGKSANKDVVRGHLASPSDSKNVPNAITWRNRAQNLEAAAGISLKTGNYHMWSILPGLSYWAHMNDIRSTNWTEEPEKQRPGLRLTSFFFDVNEANLEYNYSNREARNQYWLAAKYGGYLTQARSSGSTVYNTNGYPYYESDDQTRNNLVWSDLVKAQGGNTNGDANPEPRTYYVPSSGRDVLKAFDEIFSSTGTLAQRSIGGADNSGGLTGNSYQAEFDGSNWSGDVLAESVPTGTTPASIAWRASEYLPAPAARNIFVGSRAINGGTSAKKFTAGDAPAEVITALSEEGADAADRINWLRGDTSKDGDSLRNRGGSSVIGDIINSGVKFVGAPSATTNLGAGFDLYVAAHASRAGTDGKGGTVYVGANDGMLHAFDAATGVEQFAYIPSMVVKNLAALTSSNYVHQPYVDATPVIGDAVINPSYDAANATASDWATVLVGGLGGGGKGVYALNVTDPTSFSESSVMWEFTEADDPDMGYVLGQARIVKLLYTKADPNDANSTNSYRWFALVPAGVNNYVADADSTQTTVGSGDATLFLLALDKPSTSPWTQGSNYWKFNLAHDASLAATHPSGVLNVEAFTGVGSVTEYVYAGDLHGQLWALRFRGNPASSWNLATLSDPYNSRPLYVAKDKNGTAQPITVAPTILEGAGNGVHFVSFGTGKYFEPSDAYSTDPINTFYTVYSNFNSSSGDFASGTRGIIPGRDYLQEVALDNATTPNPSNGTTYYAPKSTFYWGWIKNAADPNTRSGWFYDFEGEAEREVSDATWISLTSRLTFSSLTPSAATESGVCGSKGGGGKVYTFDMISGKGFQRASTVGMLAQPLIFFGTTRERKSADSTGRRLRITPIHTGQFGADGSATEQVEEIVVPFGRLSWRRVDNYQELSK